MLPAKRRLKILDLIEEKGSATVLALSQALGVSEMTIRRDLTIVEQDGVIRKTYGGAVSVFGTGLEPAPKTRRVQHQQEKERIAQKALEYIDDGDTLIFDCSTTALALAQKVKKLKLTLTIITPGVFIPLELTRNTRISIVSSGGMFSPSLGGYVGPMAEEFFTKVNVDKLFFSCFGIHFKGLTDPNILLASLKKFMIQSAEQVILLADYSKFGKKGLAWVCPLNDIHTLITDSKTPQEFTDAFSEMGVNVICSNDTGTIEGGE